MHEIGSVIFQQRKVIGIRFMSDLLLFYLLILYILLINIDLHLLLSEYYV